MYEVVVAFGLLGVLIAFVAQMLTSTAAAQRATERRALALLAAANVAERASSIPYDQWNEAGLAAAQLDQAVTENLPEGKLKWTVAPSTSGPAARRLEIEISWPPVSGGVEPPVRLSHWMFASRLEETP